VYRLSADTVPDKIAVLIGRLLYRFVFPRLQFKGSARVGRLPWLRDRRVRVTHAGVAMTVPALDPFWAGYIYTGREYEPELGHAIRLLGPVGSAQFLDCGANYGFWSTRVAAGEFGPLDVTAIEASQSTHALLAQNLAGKAVALWSAINDHVGDVSFDDTLPHQARQISTAGKATVPGTTIDALADGHDRIIIKLDVEGAETAALAGAAQTLKSADVAFLYEDHASDQECESTVAVLSAGLTVFYVSPENEVRTIENLDQVRRISTDLGMGYNFVAVTPGGEYEATLLGVRETLQA
jgi:FkbM family methyltransferase